MKDGGAMTDETNPIILQLSQIAPWEPGDEIKLPAVAKDAIDQEDIFEKTGAMALLAMNIPKPEPIIDHVLNQDELTLIGGPSKLGKSHMLFNMGMCIAAGRDWMGCHVPQPRKVVMFQKELGYVWCKERIEMMLRGYCNQDYLNALCNRLKIPGIIAFDPTLLEKNFIIPKPVTFKIDDPEGWGRAKAQIIRDNIEVVLLDSLYSLHNQKESDSTEMTRVMEEINDIKLNCGASILGTHHFGKATKDNRGGDALRGSSVIGGATDNNILFKAVEDDVIIERNGLDGEASEYGVLEFQMRHSKPIPPILMHLNPDYLIWERAKSGNIDLSKAKKVEKEATPVLMIVAAMGKGVHPRTTVIKKMQQSGWGGDKACRAELDRLDTAKIITLVPSSSGHGTAKDVILPQWEL